MAASDPGAIWNHVNTLIQHGHGPLENILNYYTLDHVENFLAEIDSDRRRAYRESIYANRAAQLDKKHFQKMIADMDRQERLIRILRRKQYIADGHTEKEAEWLVKNASEKRFSDLPAKEQKKLTKELDQMFASIPEEYRERAKELSGF